MSLERSRSDVERILEFAKLEKSELMDEIQCVQFDEDLDDDQFRIIEIDSTILSTLQAGQCVTIRGIRTDSAVLCTDDATYEIKGAETSNTLLLLPQLLIAEQLTNSNSDPVLRTVSAVKHNYYELRRMKPVLTRLREKLEENPYRGPSSEQLTPHTSFEELLNEVQASRQELKEMLNKLQACEINGCWRVIEFDYMISILFAIIACADENSWSLRTIPFTQTCLSLQDTYPFEIVDHVLSCFTSQISQSSDSSHERFVELNEDVTCRVCAELVLRSSVEFNLTEFEETWKATIPEGLVINYDQLKGLALIRRDIKPEIIQYFPVESLSEDIEERFRILFRKKEKWTLEEISPYLEDVTSDKITVASLLTKHCRVTNVSGVRLYGSRK